MLANKLDGTEDHQGRGPAKQIWDDMRMDRLREQVLADVDGEFHAGRLRWRAAKAIIQDFPKRGELDQYLEGMEDEGDPDDIALAAAAWRDDAELPGESESETEAQAALAAAEVKIVIRHDLSEGQQRIAEEARARLATLRRIEEDAKTLPHPRILQMIQASIHATTTEAMGGEPDG